MSRYVPTPITTELGAHPAVRAWAALRPQGSAPSAVIPLKPQRKESQKSGVYKLCGAGAAGHDLIAKRCRAKKALRERIVYEQLLPELPMPRLSYYGFVDEPDGANTWLFLEDAGTRECRAEDQDAFTEWLGTLHTSASALGRPTNLQERGPARYLEHVQSARRRILASLGSAHFLPEDVDVQDRIVRLLDRVEDRWSELTAPCQTFPQTLVHGDLSAKNIRVRHHVGEPQFFALDWETAGWGAPAADLGALAHDDPDSGAVRVETYFSTVRPAWTCSRSDIERLAHVGVVFRMAAAIDWVSYSLPHAPVQRPVRYLRSYERCLLQTISQLGWN